MPTAALFDECAADSPRTPRDRAVQGNDGTGLVFAIHRHLEPLLTPTGRDELRSQIAAAATGDFEDLFEVLESWVRSVAFECDPVISRRVEAAFAMITAGDDDSFSTLDELLSAIK